MQIVDSFLAELESQGLQHGQINEADGHIFVHCGVRGKGVAYDVVFIFTDDHDAEIAAMQLATCPPEKKAAVLPVLNEFNARCRWSKLVMMPDGIINMRADAIVDAETAGGVCVELFVRIMRSVDEVYPDLMKAMWNN